MSRVAEFQDLLGRALDDAGLLPGGHDYDRLARGVRRLGEEARESLAAEVGSMTWKRSIKSLELSAPDDECARVLGFGHTLTDFLVAPVELAEADRPAVIRLGALANFTVTAYDRLIDLGHSPALLPRWALESAADRGRAVSLAAHFVPARRRLVSRLVLIYFRSLNRLALSRDAAWVPATVRSMILRMYAAERATVECETVPEEALEAKSVLPFVVMALPAWSCCRSFEPDRFAWHLQWLAATGAFLGRIDDAVDLEEDLANGHPNPFSRIGGETEGAPTDLLALAQNIAQQGGEVLHEWRAHVRDGAASAQGQSLGVCVASWMGGQTRHTPVATKT